MYDVIKAILPYCTNEKEFQDYLQSKGINVKFKLKRTTEEIEGISFSYDNVSFKGSQIDRKFSFGNLKKEFEKNLKIQREQAEKAQQQTEKRLKAPAIEGIELTTEQWKILKDGGYIYLENMSKKDGTGKFSSYVFLNDENNKAFFSNENPDSFVKYGKYEMRIRDKILIENGHITKAKVKWYGIGNYAHPYLWKEKKEDAEYKESWGDPRLPKPRSSKTEKWQISPKVPKRRPKQQR